MEIHGVHRKVCFPGLIVDVEIKRIDICASFIADGDAGPLAKRHQEKRVQGLIRGHGQWSRFKLKVISQSESEKVPDWSLNTCRRFTVPIHPQDEFFQVILLRRSNGDPNVSNDSRTGIVEQGNRVTRCYLSEVVISAAAVITRSTLLNIVVRGDEVGEGRIRVAPC